MVEIGASLGVPVGVARVLVSDLANAGYLVVHLPPAPATPTADPARRSWRGCWMDYVPADVGRRPAPVELIPLKVLVAGGFGVGKTTFVTRAVGDPAAAHRAGDDQRRRSASTTPPRCPDKRTTTVAMDFGRITVDESLILYLFGTPGQDRFWFMWDELARGSVGAVVLVDLRRVDDCFPAIDYFENRRLPFVVAVNGFPGTAGYNRGRRSATRWRCRRTRPLVWMDARDAGSSLDTLVALVEHALHRSNA